MRYGHLVRNWLISKIPPFVPAVTNFIFARRHIKPVKPVMVVKKVDPGSRMYKMGIRWTWTSSMDNLGEKTEMTYMVLLFIGLKSDHCLPSSVSD